ncbi:MAG: cupin domain-containing protein [Gammaproteobacteria bacterium]|nr:cupin domain-containing protein [Gammaproteobacteria bacterium]
MVVSIRDAFDRLRFLGDRTPETPPEQSQRAFARLADYRDGAVFIGHYAGDSAWERHPNGDEFVMVVEGQTTLFLIVDGAEVSHTLAAGEFIVVPERTWHRFETPEGVKIMTITPQPTDHSIERPEG